MRKEKREYRKEHSEKWAANNVFFFSLFSFLISLFSPLLSLLTSLPSLLSPPTPLS
jgi:hypothetical protein